MSIFLAPWTFMRLLIQSVILAAGQIWSNKLRSVLTTTGIVIGVASVVAVVAGLTGLEALVVDELEMFGAKRIGVWPVRPETGPMKRVSWSRVRFYPEQFEGLLDHCPSVDCFTRTTGFGATVSFGSHRVETVDVQGVDPSAHKISNRSVIMGREFSHIDMETGAQVCVIEEKLRDKLSLDRECIGQKILIGDRTYTIVGIAEPPAEFKLINTGGGESYTVFVPFTAIYNRDSWMGVDALAKSADVAEEAQAEIKFFLRRTRNIKPGEPDTFGVQTVQRILEGFRAISMGVTAVAGSIVAISLLVGGIGIMNIMLVSVSERTREIGLRKAVGAKPSAVLLQFLVEAVVLCLIGGGVGLGIGQLLTVGMANIPNFPLEKAHIPMWAVGLSFGFSSMVGLFFGMFPAVKAARLDPIEALRHE